MKKILFAMLLLVATSSTSSAGYAAGREGRIQAGLGAGLALHPPVRFDLQLNGEYFLYENISVGLNIDLLFRGPTTFIFEPFARYNFDLDFAPKWVPYAGAGIGGGVNTNGGGVLDIMIPDFGFKYELIDDRLFLGPDLSFHVLTNFSNTTWDFRFLFAVASWRF